VSVCVGGWVGAFDVCNLCVCCVQFQDLNNLKHYCLAFVQNHKKCDDFRQNDVLPIGTHNPLIISSRF
jgi:hypothetical protein